MKKSKRKYSATPKKIADNVSEVAVSTYQIYDRYPIVVYLKKDGSAYGLSLIHIFYDWAVSGYLVFYEIIDLYNDSNDEFDGFSIYRTY